MSRNVALVCLDTVRKDVFDRVASHLQERADVSFEQCRAASCWSVPSHASMFTGQLPHEHGVHAGSPRFDALDAAETLRGDLPGHRFVGVSANVYAGSGYGFDALFDEFVDVTRDHRYPDALDVSTFVDEQTDAGFRRYVDVLRASLGHSRPLRSLANAAAGQVKTLTERNGALADWPAVFDDGAAPARRAALDRVAGSDEPLFLFVNLMEGHEPHRDTLGYDRDAYDAPTGWSSRDLETVDVVDPSPATAKDLARYRDVYAAAVEYLDRTVDEFVAELLDATDRETTVVVTADHGENLALPDDDGHLGHVTSLTESVLHVPLLVVNPPPGYDERVREYVSHVDLRRLLAGLADGETPEPTRDRVRAEVLGITPGNDPLRETDPAYWDRSVRCVYEDETKYEWDGRGGTRVLSLDTEAPCTQTVVDGDVPTWARDAFDRPLDAIDVDATDEVDPESDVEARLRDLGYR